MSSNLFSFFETENMSYRKKQQYRSWNASALGLKTDPEEPDKINDLLAKDNQRPRRESWSQPPQRGRSVRGRGVWTLDNRHHDNRPNVYRRHTMPNSNSKDDFQDRDCNYRTDDESNKCNQCEEDNPIAEEPRNSSTSSGSDCDYTKENIREKCEYQSHKENFSRVRKYYSTDNIYRPPKSRSASYASSDDGSHTKYEPKNINNNEPDQVWTHDKYESLESDQKDTKNAINASAPVSPLNNEFLKNNNTQEVSTCEFTQKINKPESPKEPKTIINSEHPHVITINIRDLTAKGTNEELKTEVVDREVASEVIPKVPKVTPNINSEINPKVTPEVTEIISEVEANLNVNPESDSKVNHEVISETNIEVTPVEELPLINLDEELITGTQSTQTKISEDILTLDWDSYQKDLIEQELKSMKSNLERQTFQTPNLRKLDTELMAFDSLL